MKHTKKLIVIGMIAAILAAAAIPAMAEAAGMPSAQGQQIAQGGKGMGGRGMGGMNRGQQGGVPAQPGNGMNGMRYWNGNGVAPDQTAPDAASGATGKAFGRGMRGHRGGAGVGALVQQGVIDQETADKIEAYYRSKKTDGRLDELVQAGVIDQETADRIRQAFEGNAAADAAAETPAAPAQPEGGDPALAALVEQGVITQEQADAIEAARAAQPAPEGAPEEAPAPEADAEV